MGVGKGTLSIIQALEQKEKADRCDRLIEKANEYLVAATFQCYWRISGTCWSKCKARDYCQPDKHGLETVNHLGKAEG